MYVSIGVMVFMFLFTPYVGSVIDNNSKKKIIIWIEIANILTIMAACISSMLQGEIHVSYLLLIIFVGAIYDGFKYSTITAWTQNIFTKESYNKVNSILEVQGQAALMLCAGLTALLVGKISITYLLLFDIATSVIAIILYMKLPNGNMDRPEDLAVTERNVIKKVILDFKYSLSFITTNKKLMTFLFLTLFPSIIVLTGNYLNPLFIYKFLLQDPSIQGISSMLYAIGAIIGGMVPLYLLRKISVYTAVKITNFFFFISILLIPLFPMTLVFLSTRILSGISNASTRVLRKNVLLDTIPNHLIGRINTIFNSISTLTRVILTAILGGMISNGSIIYGYYFISFLLLLSFLVLYSFKGVNMKKFTLDEVKENGQINAQ
ncbi:hypothetical protein YDYSG_24450 [Paenibacillus tyrfis]|nr:hypothetical protein YDYSG_24450 [Paenibacillus tyrfis]